MLPRKNRIATENFPRVTRGKTVADDAFRVVFFRDDSLTYPKCAVIVSKKVANTAVARNRLRRQTYAVLGENLTHLPNGYISVFPTTKDSGNSLPGLKKLILCLKK